MCCQRCGARGCLQQEQHLGVDPAGYGVDVRHSGIVAFGPDGLDKVGYRRDVRLVQAALLCRDDLGIAVDTRSRGKLCRRVVCELVSGHRRRREIMLRVRSVS